MSGLSEVPVIIAVYGKDIASNHDMAIKPFFNLSELVYLFRRPYTVVF